MAALSVEAEEYVNYTFAEGPGCDIKLHWTLRLQFLSFGEFGVYLLPGSLLPGVVVTFRVLSMGQIELFYHLLKIIIISYSKPYSCE